MDDVLLLSTANRRTGATLMDMDMSPAIPLDAGHGMVAIEPQLFGCSLVGVLWECHGLAWSFLDFTRLLTRGNVRVRNRRGDPTKQSLVLRLELGRCHPPIPPLRKSSRFSGPQAQAYLQRLERLNEWLKDDLERWEKEGRHP